MAMVVVVVVGAMSIARALREQSDQVIAHNPIRLKLALHAD